MKSTVENLSDYKEIVDVIKANGGEAFKLCYQCGLCDAVCPWNKVRSFSMRKIIREAPFGLTEIESDEMWRCTTCGNCPRQCPRGVEIIEAGVSLRRIATEYGVFPTSVNPVRGVGASLLGKGNPLGEDRGKRAEWAEGLSVKKFTEGMEILYFPGCYLCYDPRLKKVARATAAILKRARIDFGILGPEENCCGESVRKIGGEDTFQSLAAANIKLFNEKGVKKIITTSPHCLYTFSKEYAELGGEFEVMHYAQLLGQLVEDGKMKISKDFAKKVVFHDPCYLGRHNEVYEAPRKLLDALPKVERVEMDRFGAESICCGGGGGRIWTETDPGARFGDLRITDAIAKKCDMIATACPYCTIMLDASNIGVGNEDLKIKDIAEILDEAME